MLPSFTGESIISASLDWGLEMGEDAPEEGLTGRGAKRCAGRAAEASMCSAGDMARDLPAAGDPRSELCSSSCLAMGGRTSTRRVTSPVVEPATA